MPRTLVVLVNLALILLCLGLGASPAGAQMPDASQPPVDPALTAILSDAAAALGWEERPTSSPTGAEVAHSTPGDPCASPVSGTHVAPGDTVVYVALGVGEAPAAPEGSLTHAQVNLHGVVADLVLARPADDPPPEGWGDAAWAAHLTWPMGGQRLGALVETNCPLGVRVEEEIVPLAEALFAAARAHGWQADPDALLSSAAGSTVAPPAPTAAPDLLIEWQPRHLAALGESAELLITPLDEEGQPSPNQPVTITRVEPPGISVEGVTGEAGSLRCSIAHDVPEAEFYRYAVRAGDVERVVEIPVVGVRFILEGNPISGGAYRGVAADGVSTLAVQVEVSGWQGQVRLEAPEHGTLEDVDGQPLAPGRLALDPHGRAEFAYRPPDYLDVVSSTVEGAVAWPADLDARGVLDELRLVLVEGGSEGQAVSVEMPVVRPPVVLVHGLDGEPAALGLLEGYLSEVGYDVDVGDYVREPGDEAGATPALAALLRQRVGAQVAGYAREGIKLGRVDIVAHSTGGLVARHYVQDAERYRGDVRKLIMLGTPNHGVGLHDRPLSAVLSWWQRRVGAAREDLHPTSTLLRMLNAGEDEGRHLVPDIEYAVLAGRMPAEEFIDPHLPGDPAWAYVATDGVVTVSSARLNGAPLYLIDGACHCAELNQLSPVPRPEPGIAAFRGAWERVGGLLGAPIPQPPLDDERILVLAGEGCTLADGEGVRTLEEPWPIEVPAWSTLRTTGRALLALTSGGTTWALVSLAPDTEILFDAPGRDLVRSLLTRGGARFQHVGRGALANRFSVLVGEAPGSQDLFRPLARVWDLEGDLVVEAHERPRAYALSGRVVAETQKADDVAVGRLLGAGDVVEVGAGAVTPAEAGDAWWADGFYRPPPSEAVRQLRRVGNVALGVMVLGLVALGVGWADHGRYEPALEDLRREGESLRMSLSDGAVRRLDLQTLTTQDYGGRWWSYEPLTDAWFVSVADEWLSATPPRYSSRRPWVIVGSLLAVVGGVVAVATLLMQ